MKKITLGLFMLSSMVFSSQAADVPSEDTFGGFDLRVLIVEIAKITLFGTTDRDEIYLQDAVQLPLKALIVQESSVTEDQLKEIVEDIVETQFQRKLDDAGKMDPFFDIQGNPEKHIANAHHIKAHGIKDIIIRQLTTAWHPKVVKAIKDASAAKKNAQ